MGNLSEHFNKEDFTCKCGACPKEYRISLTLVGILEDLITKFGQPVKIIRGFVCEDAILPEIGPKKNYHNTGKAIDFAPPAEKIIEIFRYLESFPEITGLGIDLENKYIHLDLREKDTTKWIFIKGEAIPLTEDLRKKHELGSNIEKNKIPESLTLELPVELA